MLIPIISAVAYTAAYYVVVRDWQLTLWLAIGLVIGCGFYYLDAMILSKKYADPGETPKPISHSVIMLALYWPLAIFVATSTGSLLGLGLILGLGAGLTWDIIRLQNNADLFKAYFQFPAKTQLNDLEIQVASFVWSLAFLWLAASYLW